MRFQSYLLVFLVILSFFTFISDQSYLKPERVRCHDHEKAALLQFQQSFLIDCDASTPPSAYPKMISWQEHTTVADCCTWDGVECSKETDFVIGLDLSSSCLYGTFPSNSSLFILDHLLELNLGDNYFDYSPIPSSIGKLYRLESLNLYGSYFSGLVPVQMSSLSSLTVLDLSSNVPTSLAFGYHSFDKLVTNLTRLTTLYLNSVRISSVVPPVLSNMTSLTVISLPYCQLYGEFPQGIFQLPNLDELYLSGNLRLKGHLPEFHRNSPLTILDLKLTEFSGELPSSIGNLGRLNKLSILYCSFSGYIPASLGSLTKLRDLNLAVNGFSGTMPSSLTNLTNLESLALSGLDVSPVILDSRLLKLNKLTSLRLNNMNMGKTIPTSLCNLTRLTDLDLQNNQLSGTMPQWFANLTQLIQLQLNDNQLEGSVQPWLSKLVNLYSLDLSDTNFAGIFEQFFELPNILELFLDNFNLTFFPNAISNYSTIPKLTELYLSSCNLTEFPQILRYQNKLQMLYLHENHIEGVVPQWFMNATKDSLMVLNISYNSLVGFEEPAVFLPWTNLQVLDLSNNKLRGPLPVPLNATQVYVISNNHLYGAIPKQICLANSLVRLDLSNNSMDGNIPQCIGHQLGNSLQVLNLRGNSFHGTIPQSFHKSCSLKMINLSENQFEGPLPRSLANCTMLEVLDLGKNRINDTFPSWLGPLSALQVLILRHNRFHSKIRSDPKSSQAFGRLRIIDLSYNFLTGSLPSSYFQSWRAMQVTRENQSSTSNTVIMISLQQSRSVAYYTFNYVITIMNKGSETLYPKIFSVFRVVDFSSNNFIGKIPSFLGDLKGLQALNLSNNHLEGNIPSSLSKITDLESLDLSQNKLSGAIPRELSKLTFLAVFNASHNRLVGPIPQGEQFDTFDNSSYDGNLALCGVPLSKKCGRVLPSPGLPSQQETDVETEQDEESIGWMIRAFGCASGLIVGFITGKLYITDRHHGWFIKTFATKRKSKKRNRFQFH